MKLITYQEKFINYLNGTPERHYQKFCLSCNGSLFNRMWAVNGNERVPNREGIVDRIMWGKNLSGLWEKFQVTPLSCAWCFILPL